MLKKIKSILKKLFLKVEKISYLFYLRDHPISEKYGLDRGTPIDRFYIENFLQKNKNFIRGKCLEILDRNYTTKYGNNVSTSDVLDINKENKSANIIGDLRDLKEIKDNTYDCIILTQVLQFIDNPEKAIKECYRILKENGVVLCTIPSVSRIDCRSGEEGDYWRFTKASGKMLFEKYFVKNNIICDSEGNLLANIWFLMGLSLEEISKRKLQKNDSNFPCIITISAKK